MIRKYLVIGRQIQMSSKRNERKEENLRELEVLMPIETYWKIEKILKDTDYMIASGEDNVAIQDTYKRIFRLIVAYAVTEKDRAWLNDKI